MASHERSSTKASPSWEVMPYLPGDLFKEAARYGIQPVQAQLLHNRGITSPEEMQRFLNARFKETRDPFQLIDMRKAVTRIQQALESKEHITVYGDYDADGVTSSALLYRALRRLKQPDAPLSFHIPDRLHDGCGLNLPALDMLKARGTSLIVTTDCASSDVEQVAYARSLAMDVIITDHHHPPAELPAAVAMVNPWRPDCPYGERYLCGVGIAFKLAQALYQVYQRPEEELLELLDLVAIGTIADIAPLLGENHILVQLGLQRLNRTQKCGLLELIKHTTLRLGSIRERDIAFSLAPRINAAGRMKDAGIAFRLLTTDDPEEGARLAAELNALNLSRQQETETLMRFVREEAQKHPAHPVILVSGQDWHEGIIGLVAGKLADELQKPVLVVSHDQQTQLSRGSARSQKNYNIIEALRSFPGEFVRFGGHTQAAGFTIASDAIPELYEHLLNWTGSPLTAIVEETEDEEEQAELERLITGQPRTIDLVFEKITLSQLTYDFYLQIRRLGPFGNSNPEPVFKMEHLRLLRSRVTGRSERLNLSVLLEHPEEHGQQRWATVPRGGHLFERLKGVKHVNIIFSLEASEDENRTETWIKILDIQPSEQTENTQKPV